MSLDDDLDLEKRGVGAKKVMLIKNVETVVENMKIGSNNYFGVPFACLIN